MTFAFQKFDKAFLQAWLHHLSATEHLSNKWIEVSVLFDFFKSNCSDMITEFPSHAKFSKQLGLMTSKKRGKILSYRGSRRLNNKLIQTRYFIVLSNITKIQIAKKEYKETLESSTILPPPPPFIQNNNDNENPTNSSSLTRTESAQGMTLLSCNDNHQSNNDSAIPQPPHDINLTQSLSSESESESTIILEDAPSIPPTPVPPPPRLNLITHPNENSIIYALQLNLSRVDRHSDGTPERISRDGERYIQIIKRKQANEKERTLVALTCLSWGYANIQYSNAEKLRIAKAACNQVSYDCGLKKMIGYTQVQKWMRNVGTYLLSGNLNYLSPNHSGSKKYVDMVETQNKGYLLFLWRYAIMTLGPKATFSEITKEMNSKSAVASDIRPTLSLHRIQVFNWFHSKNGKELSPVEKPLDTPTHVQARIKWVRKHYDLLIQDNSPVAFLDEKWFYTTNRRNKLKYLPLQPGEAPGADKLYRSKMRCRRHPVKSMFLGVVARPRPDLNFDGKIHIERVCKTRPLTRMCTHTSFSNDICINLMLKKG